MQSDEERKDLQLQALRNAPPIALFDDPIEYFFADHFRQRTLCNVLDEIADASTPDGELIAAAVEFLKNDFNLHVEDEEKDLFPELVTLVGKDQNFLDVLKQLQEEHNADHIDAKEIIDLLEAHLLEKDTRKLTPALKDLLRRFADNERRHLTTENAIVLPVARSKLNSAAQAELGRKMANRRKSGKAGAE